MLPTTRSPSENWLQSFGFPSRLFGTGFDDDYDLYEEDEAYVLTLDMPGFDLEDVHASWDQGSLFVWAEHEDAEHGRRKSYRRTFRLPKEIEPDDIEARYRNGVLEVRLPIVDARVRGTEIEVTG